MRNLHIIALTAVAAGAFAQPANNNQGYRPGVTVPQQGAPQTPASRAPGLGGFFNRNQATPTPAVAPIATPIVQPTLTPAAPSSSASSSQRSNSASSSRSSSGSSRSTSQSGKSKSDDDTPKKTSTSSKSTSSKSDSDSSEKKSSPPVKTPEPKNEDSGSALDKIVKDMGNKEAEAEKPAKPTPTPKPTKEELEERKKELQRAKDIDDATTVVAKFIEAANGGDYEKANQYLSPATRKYFDSESSAIYGTRSSVLNDLTGHWSLTLATYLNIIVQGQGAQVQTELKYKDGRSVMRNFDLIKVEGEWKIDLPVTEETIKASKKVSAAPVETPAATPVPALTPPPAPTGNPGGSLGSGIPTPEQAASIPLPLVVAPDSAETTKAQ